MSRLEDAARLRRLYDERAPKDMTQGQFGETYGIGNQSMVSQCLSGHRPLNYDIAAKFAKGLGCSIEDISPELAKRLMAEVFPFARRRTVKAALFILCALCAAISQRGEAAFDISVSHFKSAAVKIHIALVRLRSIFLKRRQAAWMIK